jgi:uncharacterized membrane protein YphA (DoxX/SURF4 family)
MVYTSFMIAHYVAVAHLVGGLMLLFGLYTRLATLVQLPVLIDAVFLLSTLRIQCWQQAHGLNTH